MDSRRPPGVTTTSTDGRATPRVPLRRPHEDPQHRSTPSRHHRGTPVGLPRPPEGAEVEADTATSHLHSDAEGHDDDTNACLAASVRACRILLVFNNKKCINNQLVFWPTWNFNASFGMISSRGWNPVYRLFRGKLINSIQPSIISLKSTLRSGLVRRGLCFHRRGARSSRFSP